MAMGLICLHGRIVMSAISKTVLSFMLLAASVSGVHAAGAGSGTIAFEGEILEAACSIKPGDSDQTIQLGEIAKSQLALGGSSRSKEISIELTGCSITGLADKTVSATFTGAASADVSGALGIAGDAKGAGIMLVDGSGTAITLGAPTQVQLLQAGDNTLVFNAYLKGKATGDITPGRFAAVTNFSLAYL